MTLADDWRVQRNAKTNLLCDFYLHQHVCTMHENKIVEGEIVCLSLAHGSLGDNAANALYGDMAEQLYYDIGYCFTNGRTPKTGFQREQIIKKNQFFEDARSRSAEDEERWLSDKRP